MGDIVFVLYNRRFVFVLFCSIFILLSRESDGGAIKFSYVK